RGARALAQTAAALRRGSAPADGLVAALSMLVAHHVSPVYLGNPWSRQMFWASGVHAASFMLVAGAVGLQASDLGASRLVRALRSLAVSSLAGAITLAFFYAVFYRPIGRWVIGGATVLTATAAFLLDEGLLALLKHRPRRVLFLG